MAADTPDDFQKGRVDLFVQEAHEWLQDIHVALDELEQGPAPERHAELIETVSSGVMNLGRSAATIDLPEVKQAIFAAIPFIEAVQDPQKVHSVQDFLSLCKQLGQIHTALTRATVSSCGDDGNRAATIAVDASLSPGEFLQALQGLQKAQPPGAASGHNLICDLIEQMEGLIRAGVERIDVSLIQGYLVRVSEAEESFLKAIDERVPEIVAKVSALKIDGGEASSRMMALETSLQNVARLRAEAQQVNAGSAMMFFTGLHNLLTVMAQRRVLLDAPRVESVQARLHVMRSALRQWREYGRAQRAAIDQLLPASPT